MQKPCLQSEIWLSILSFHAFAVPRKVKKWLPLVAQSSFINSVTLTYPSVICMVRQVRSIACPPGPDRTGQFLNLSETVPVMFSFYVRLTGKNRDHRTNRVLGVFMAFIAGAINAGGFLAIQKYTSHMTGIISGIADDLVVSELKVVFAGLIALASFVAGAATTSIFINWTRRQGLHSEYALSISLEAFLLLIFGLLGANLNVLVEVFVPTTFILLCYIMGLQNALMTKVSQAEIRTTHMTGIVTDIGIELGRLLYWNRSRHHTPEQNVRANRSKLVIHLSIFGAFLVGGIAGAYSFKAYGYQMTIPIALFLFLLAAPPLTKDVCGYLRTHLFRTRVR